MNKIVNHIIFAALIYNVEPSKILGIFNSVVPSHYILGSALMKGLAEKGHDVTVISSFGEKTVPKNLKYRDIVLTGFYEDMEKMNINFVKFGERNYFMSQIFKNFMGKSTTDKTLNHPNVQKLLYSSHEKFDVVIIEQFVNDALKGIAEQFKAPLVIFCTTGASSLVNHLVANPSNPSYVPDLLLNYPPQMTFSQRIYNTLASVFSDINRHTLQYYTQKSVYNKHFPNGPNFGDVIYNASLVLLNSHVSVSQPIPQVPTMVNIGGYHIKPPKKLPADLQEFLNKSTNGVIYFSLGSNAKSIHLPKETQRMILNTFSKLKQNVLWKFEDEELPGQPKNVKIGKWLPQQDILAHPNVKLFISHCGMLSVTETIYHGIPILAVPLFADQLANAEHAVANGYALKLNHKDITEERLISKIKTLLDDPRYSQTAKRYSIIMRDDQNDPLDTANFWIEYVIRHKGAPHFRLSALNLSWCQYLLLDVIFVVGVSVIVLGCIAFLVIKRICKVLRRSKSKEKIN